ncbi:hypothetical protein [Mucilaginibacter pedocola]|uniref:Uncharacterized protein n=1 Tax=Mucilaginibacter pedocola TaxID=1792845 RepID=A0A1S9PEH3_9SPHI|nr:hypothetical protein [Mucilaginibacter pedocola]OOQ59341.1 hypothetical protein BC343_27990 [Mucilaginibacter pedocola]
MQKGVRVILKTFLGETTAPESTEPWNDYWKLLGEEGEVIGDEIYNQRVLVLFHTDLNIFKLANHNPVPNSLWILPSDLETINTK